MDDFWGWAHEVLGEYAHIMSDPSHLLAEATFISVEVLFLVAIYQPFKRRRDRRAEARITRVVEARVAAEHKIIDAEHGVTHPDESVAAPVEASTHR